MKQRNTSLDIIRIFACLMVIGYKQKNPSIK